MIQKAYKFRIYPNKTQTVLINKTFGCVRYAWNRWVENFNKPKDATKVFNSPREFREELEWMKDVPEVAIGQKKRDFWSFKQQFFNKNRKSKVGRPAFKSRKSKQSFRLSKVDFYIKNNKVRLLKVGFVKTVFDRAIPIDAKFINCTVSKDKVGDFFVSILVEQHREAWPKTNKAIGIDVGLKSFAVLSDETVIANPRHFRENQSKLKRMQQHFARKVKGSHHREQTRKQVARIHRKTARQRSHFLHNVSTSLVRDFDIIAIEDLNIQGMMANHCLAKSIADVSWSEFYRQLEYKAAWYGKEIRKVNRFEPTSKTCNVCGYYFKDMTLDIRNWDCPCCGVSHDRDLNAAKNILKNSAKVEAELQTWRECKSSGQQTEAVPCEVSRVEV